MSRPKPVIEKLLDAGRRLRALKAENAALRAGLAQLKDTLEVWRRVNEAMETVPSYLSTPDGERLLADARMKLRFVFQSPPIEGVSTQSAALDRLKALELAAILLRDMPKKFEGSAAAERWLTHRNEVLALLEAFTSGFTLGEGESDK